MSKYNVVMLCPFHKVLNGTVLDIVETTIDPQQNKKHFRRLKVRPQEADRSASRVEAARKGRACQEGKRNIRWLGPLQSQARGGTRQSERSAWAQCRQRNRTRLRV